MLTLQDVTLRFGDQVILNNISFNIEKGKILGLIGPNGAGKSSIIKVLAGLVFKDSGNIYFNDVLQTKSLELRKACGFLIDSPAFYPYLTARQNLYLIKKINECDIDVDALLKQVGLINIDKKKVKHFSTGMKQRLAIAFALIRSPKIIILDEPFNGLDPNGFQEILVMLKQLNNNGTTIVISSHLLRDLEEFADAFILINQGKVALQITKNELENTKKKITFTFEEQFNTEAENYISSLNGVLLNNTKAILELQPKEIVNTVNNFVRLGSTPINVETHTILQQKYFEITN